MAHFDLTAILQFLNTHPLLCNIVSNLACGLFLRATLAERR